jgi:hypothetical protein
VDLADTRTEASVQRTIDQTPVRSLQALFALALGRHARPTGGLQATNNTQATASVLPHTNYSTLGHTSLTSARYLTYSSPRTRCTRDQRLTEDRSLQTVCTAVHFVITRRNLCPSRADRPSPSQLRAVIRRD